LKARDVVPSVAMARRMRSSAFGVLTVSGTSPSSVAMAVMPSGDFAIFVAPYRGLPWRMTMISPSSPLSSARRA
jgi:hypothetical protein